MGSHHHLENQTSEQNNLIFDSCSVKVQQLVKPTSVPTEFLGIKVRAALATKTAVEDWEHH